MQYIQQAIIMRRHNKKFGFVFTPKKFQALLVFLLGVSAWYQGAVNSTLNLTTSLILQQRGLKVEEEFPDRRIEQRNFVRNDEFWLTESEHAFLPFDVEYLPPREDWGVLEKVWSCSDPDASKGRSTKLIFVHIVHSGGDFIHELLDSYASTCEAGFASAAMCSGLSWESMVSGSWANRQSIGGKAGKCVMMSARNRTGKIYNKQYIQSEFLTEKVDLLVGQVPLGCHEQWKMSDNKKAGIVEAIYFVSLRNPYDWFISSMIARQEAKNGTKIDSVDTIVPIIKEKVEKDLNEGLYHEVYSRYLITPAQVSWIQKEQADLGAEHRVGLALRNLVEKKAVIAIAEDIEGSLKKVRYVIDVNDKAFEDKIQKKREAAYSVSSSMSAVMESLKEDKDFFGRFQEYLMYENQIYDEAKSLHARQLEWLRKSSHINA